MLDKQPASAGVVTVRSPGQTALPRRVYPFRMLGMATASLPTALVLREQHAPWWLYGLLAGTALVWPQLAYWLARRSRDPYRVERRNLMLDSALSGLWTAGMHFNALPSVLLLSVANADKINTGVRGLWQRSLVAMLLGIGVGGLLTGFAWQPVTSMTVLLASLPLLVVHTLAVSLGNYRLVRRVQVQNRQLEALSRRDGLTGLPNRRHWQEAAAALQLACIARGQHSSLLLIDLDHFKAINDAHGHALGDDVLCVLAGLLSEAAAQHGGEACRLDGDEFALALPLAGEEAEAVAQRLLEAMAQRRWRPAPGLCTTLSIGIAGIARGSGQHDALAASDGPAPDRLLRHWLEAADTALYAAKRDGRNCMRRATTATPPAADEVSTA